jgi:radical SAM superfamily enzyme YgiQ (UPF0313 family)
MRITFIRPNLWDTRSSDAMEPLSFAILESLTPSDVETKFYDQRLEAIPYDEPTDLAALTVETYTARQSYRIAGEYRRRGVKVVMGGYHPTLAPRETLRFADSIVQGDAERIWERVVADAEKDRLEPIYRNDGFPSIETTRPDRSIFEGKSYLPVALVQYGRGCRYNCEFCSIRAFYGANLRQRPVKAVVAEIERAGRKHVFFVDDNIFVDVPKAKELFRALIPLNILWFCQASIDITRDRELVSLMGRSGCANVLIGFESLNEDNLRQMRKKWNLKYGDYATSIEILRDAGLMIYGTFVFGYDRDTVESFDAAVEFSVRHKFCLANFNPLTPTPGAPLYDRLLRENRLVYEKWWLEPGYRYGEATFHPRGMTADELTEGCYRARTAFNTFGSISRRLLDLRANLKSPRHAGIYLLSNVVSRKEIHAKQGIALGGSAGADPVAERA